MHKLSDIVKAAVSAIWLSYDPETMQRGRDILQEAANEGDADAMCFLGRTFLGEQYVWRGARFPESDAQGNKLLAKSIEAGSAVGVLCAMRTGLLNDDLKAKMPYKSLEEVFDTVKAEADEGDTFCNYLVANVYFWGDYLRIYPESRERFKDEKAYDAFAYPIAAKYFEKSFEGGLSSGYGNYNSIFKSGLTDISKERINGYLQRLAHAGCPMCMSDYGQYLEYELHDEKGAFEMYRAAYERGDKVSACNLAICYFEGTGTDVDLPRAFELFNEAADAGSTSALFSVGNFYFAGLGGVEQDYAKAIHWLRRSYSRKSDWRSAAEMGVIYQTGYGDTPPDDAVAFHYLNRLEREDVIDCMWPELEGPVCTALGVAYGFGRGTEQNIEKGVQYLDRAIAAGHKPATLYRSCFYKSIFGWKIRK